MGATAPVVSLMDVTVRVLPPEEFELLKHLPPFDKSGLPNPERSWPVVAQDQKGNIVGYWWVYLGAHVEPVWIAEEFRAKPGLLRRMWRGVHGILEKIGHSVAYGVILDQDIPTGTLGQALRLGFQAIPGKLYFVNAEAPGTLKSTVDRTMAGEV